MEIAERTFLVSGGSSGLGAACVRQLLARDGRVVIADVNPPRDGAFGPAGDRWRFVRTDVVSESDVASVVRAASSDACPLRGVILCAGVLYAERIVSSAGPASLDGFRRVIDVNLTGTFNVARLAAAAMAQQEAEADGERGAIVMTSSIAAWDGQIGQAGYAAAKGGVSSLTVVLGRELARYGIRAVSLAPGVFNTPMIQAAPEKVRTSLISQAVFPQRLGEPDEFAALALHAIENRMLNGCTLRLDGGMRMAAR